MSRTIYLCIDGRHEEAVLHRSITTYQLKGMLQRELSVDVIALQQRMNELERVLQPQQGQAVTGALHQLRVQVDSFSYKIETSNQPSCSGVTTVASYIDVDAAPSAGPNSYAPRNAQEREQVRLKFYEICDVAVTDEVRASLRQVEFDSRQWRDEQLLVLLQQMYFDLELTKSFSLDLNILRAFLFAVYDNYNDVPFHNFRHCFCVAQMMYAIAWTVNLRECVGDFETLILITSCICHDLDHPGYNNIYQINARTNLALRYNDISPLENHHCSVAFHILRRPECNLFIHFTDDEFRHVREGMIRCILATDMARHNEILQQFRDIRAIFDFEDTAHVNLLSMVLIKVADISNEARPMEVAEPWLDRLLQEFFKQSDAEKLEGLPVTPFMDRDKVTKPSSQCSFIGLVLLPLFEALADLLPQLKEMIIKPVHAALDYYRRLNDAARERKSIDLEDRRLSIAEGTSGTSEFVADDSVSEDVTAHESADEDGDTITEVEASEKTLRFKISTDTGAGRTNFRKSSLDKQASLELDYKPVPATTATVVVKQAATPTRSSIFSRLKCFKERLYGNYEKSPDKVKSELCRLERRRSSTSSIAELKQSVSDDMTNGKAKEHDKQLSGSLDCVLSAKDKHSNKKGIFYRLRGGDKSSSSGSPGSKVAAFVGSFRKRARDENK